MFSIPSSTVPLVFASVQSFSSDIWPLALVVLAIEFVFFFIESIVGWVSKKKDV